MGRESEYVPGLIHPARDVFGCCALALQKTPRRTLPRLNRGMPIQRSETR